MRNKYEFSWEVLDVIISGRSSIDSPTGFQIQNADEAVRFVESYGYDPIDPIQAAEIQGNYHEALNFVRKYFLQPENPEGLRPRDPAQNFELHRRARPPYDGQRQGAGAKS